MFNESAPTFNDGMRAPANTIARFEENDRNSFPHQFSGCGKTG
jgi:hypothetical protein